MKIVNENNLIKLIENNKIIICISIEIVENLKYVEIIEMDETLIKNDEILDELVDYLVTNTL